MSATYKQMLNKYLFHYKIVFMVFLIAGFMAFVLSSQALATHHLDTEAVASQASVSVSKASQPTPVKQLFAGFTDLKNRFFTDELLPSEQAFQFFATVKDAYTLRVNWVVADGYYLYRDKIKLLVAKTQATKTTNNTTNKTILADFNIPQGKPYRDEIFGNTQIFRHSLSFDVPLLRPIKQPETITLLAQYQGCADIGVCYPPMQKTQVLQLPLALANTSLSNQQGRLIATQSPVLSVQQQIFQALQTDILALTLLSFFGFGLLAAFTPCIFPMIPILSGIIVGQGKSITTRKSFLLSISYVIASALTYTVFGILAALFGSNLQVVFQQTWVIAFFSTIFVLLALSMFGFYNLELPKSWQAFIHNSSDKHRDGSYLGAAIMGALSSLIIGPCVAAPLMGALIYIGHTGDIILGGSALFMFGLGMGVPLLVLGASVGKLLPKAGHWLNTTKAIFGVLMLAVALWMLDRILPAAIIVLFTAALLIIPAIYLQALEPLATTVTGWRKLWKGLGVIALVYGVLLLIGLSMGNTQLLQPLKGLGESKGNGLVQKSALNFRYISNNTELDQLLEQAHINKQWLMLDFYADWCIACKEMEVFTFADTTVQQKLSSFMLVQVDVSKNSNDHQALLKRFNLIGPPAILFFAPNKKEQKNARVIGYQDSGDFLVGINRLVGI